MTETSRDVNIAVRPPGAAVQKSAIALPQIDGRECVPVRLLPFLTAWLPLSPDKIAQIFSRRHEWWNWSISTYNVRPDGQYHELPAREWDSIDNALTVLCQDLKRQEAFEFQMEGEWRRQSVELLPAAVFVWSDDLVAEYASTFGRQKYPTMRPGSGGLTEAEADAELDAFIRMCEDPSRSKEVDAYIERTTEQHNRDTIYRPGDGQLNFAPLLSAANEKIVFEGFETVRLVGRLAQQWAVREKAPTKYARLLLEILGKLGVDASKVRRERGGARRSEVKTRARQLALTPEYARQGFTERTFREAWEHLPKAD